ncbi:MAG: Smr/MutS family protein [Terracidiphilus sp.]
MSPSRSIDLHQRTVRQAIADFIAFYNGCLRQGYRGRIDVIHGYGSSGTGGLIKAELRAFLEARATCFDRIVYEPGNPGMSAVYPRLEIGEEVPREGSRARRVPLPARILRPATTARPAPVRPAPGKPPAPAAKKKPAR